MMQVISPVAVSSGTTATPGTMRPSAVSHRETKGVLCQRLNRELAQRFRALTLPAYRHLLDLEPQPCAPTEGDRHLVYPLAIGASRNRSPVGLALGTLPLKEGDHPRLVSLYVTPRERRSGVASALLNHLEEIVQDRGFDRLSTVYGGDSPWARSLEGLLNQHDWSPPRPYEILLRFNLDEAAITPWYRKFMPQVSGRFSWFVHGRDEERHLAFFPWKKVRVRDLENLYASQNDKAWIPENQLPWNFERRDIETHSSLGIRLGTEIVGWVINHAIDERTLRLSHFFIRSDLARQDLLSPALVESMQRARKALFTRCQLAACWRDHEQALFIKRHLIPWCDQVGESREAVKSLGNVPQRMLL